MLIISLTLLAAISAVILVTAEYRCRKTGIRIFKPLTMLLIILAAVLAEGPHSFYRYMIIAGLLFSLAGDVWLMSSADRFVRGLTAFLCAHLCYTTAFVSGISDYRFYPLIILGPAAAAFYIYLLPALDKLKIPVLLYMTVMLVMGGSAWNYYLQTGVFSVFLGALLFIISDMILSFDRFRHTFRAAPAIKLPLYFTAQWLLALSVAARF
jgi:uncharacterized membrane protein YhhN